VQGVERTSQQDNRIEDLVCWLKGESVDIALLTSKKSNENGDLYQFMMYLNKGLILGLQTLFCYPLSLVIQVSVIDVSIDGFDARYVQAQGRNKT
jgi:hypothetical protein